jgi:hypothetical protein
VATSACPAVAAGLLRPLRAPSRLLVRGVRLDVAIGVAGRGGPA